jgi:hypothetical protein
MNVREAHCHGGLSLFNLVSGGSSRRKEEEMNSSQVKTVNPALKELEPLIGDWTMELSNASFLPDPSEIIRGSSRFEWIEAGNFLVNRQGSNQAGAPHATWLISRDDASSQYSVFYFDDRQVSRIYAMSFSEGVWNLWRNAPGFSQRFEGKLSEDGNRIQACWENSVDGKVWKHDFDLTYTKGKG